MEKQIHPPITTDSLTTELPSEFVNSKNKRYVIPIYANIFINDSLIDDQIEGFEQTKFVSLHSDFVHERRDLDSFVCFANTDLTKKIWYEQIYRTNRFTIWFKDINGQILNDKNLERVEDYYLQRISPTHTRKIKFVIQLLLDY